MLSVPAEDHKTVRKLSEQRRSAVYVDLDPRAVSAQMPREKKARVGDFIRVSLALVDPGLALRQLHLDFDLVRVALLRPLCDVVCIAPGKTAFALMLNRASFSATLFMNATCPALLVL